MAGNELTAQETHILFMVRDRKNWKFTSRDRETVRRLESKLAGSGTITVDWDTLTISEGDK